MMWTTLHLGLYHQWTIRHLNLKDHWARELMKTPWVSGARKRATGLLTCGEAGW